MKNLQSLSLATCCVISVASPARAPAQRAAAFAGRAQIRIDARVDDEPSTPALQIRGVLRLTLPRARAPQRQMITLDVGGRASTDSSGPIRIDSLRAFGARLSGRVNDARSRTVTASLARTARDSAVLTVYFTAPVPARPDPSLGYRLWDAREPGQYWYPRPTLSRALTDAYADYEVTLSRPDSLAALLSGRLTKSIRDAAAGRTIDTFAASDLEGVALAIGEGFRVTHGEYAGVQVNLFDRADPDSSIGDVIDATGAALEWYVRRIGFFPHDAIGILPGIARAIGGNPMPGIFTIHRGYTARAFLEEMTAHELGHFYWGQGVLGAPEPGALNWLMLGNSIWADQLYMAERRGISFEEQWYSPEVFNMPERFLAAQVGDFEQRLGLSGVALDSVRTDYGGAIGHAKASMGIALLARNLAVDRFLDLQGKLISRYWHREMTPDAYAVALAQAGIPDAPRWLGVWRRGDARVGYQVQSIAPAATADSIRIAVVIARTGTVDAPLTVALTDRDGRTEQRRIAGRALDTLTVRGWAPPLQVVIDPAGTLPMVSSGGWRVQGALARAMLSVGYGDIALELARQQIARSPHDSLTRGALVARLAALGRWQEVRAVMADPLAPTSCVNRVSCQSLGHLARALALTGERESAITMLNRFDAQRYRFGAMSEWRLARAAVGAR